MELPAERTGRSFERTYNLGSNPTSVEVAFLSGDQFVVDITGVHLAGIEGDITFDTRKPRARTGIVPSGFLDGVFPSTISESNGRAPPRRGGR